MVSQLIRDLKTELEGVTSYGQEIAQLIERYDPKKATSEEECKRLALDHQQIAHFIKPLLAQIEDILRIEARSSYPTDGERIARMIKSYDDISLSILPRLRAECRMRENETAPIEGYINKCKKICEAVLERTPQEKLNWTGLEVDIEKPLRALWSSWQQCWSSVDDATKADISEHIRALLIPTPTSTIEAMLNDGKLDASGARGKVIALKRTVTMNAQQLQKEEVFQPLISKLDELVALCQKYADIEKEQHRGRHSGI